MTSSIEHVDVLVVGAGISGIGAGYHLSTKCPDHTFAILEGRANLGGTWDLFRYPGIRSDSDMFTLGYSFRPWREQRSIAPGASIRAYLEETADAYDIRRHIRFHHRVQGATWSSRSNRWTVKVERSDTGQKLEMSCNFLFMCTGYYDYSGGYEPEFRGRDRFAGPIVHPQKWTEDIDYEGKRVVVIGSGATAVTLVPELAKKAAHVVMLQRSPTYIISVPSQDPISAWLRKRIPEQAAYFLTRWKNVLLGAAFFAASRRIPDRVAAFLLNRARNALGPDFDIETHLTPRYNPWDQRLCLIPDGDLFEALVDGSASIVTDAIDTFTERGILLDSGTLLEADLIVTATGLRVLFFANIELVVDGKQIDASKLMTYKSMMFSDVPNLALSFGYTNASWTLKADLTCEFVCRLLGYMSRHGYRRCVPRQNDPSMEEIPFLDFSSGYVQRALARLPKQGSRGPWRLYQSYLRDIVTLRHGRIADGVIEFA